VACITIVLRGMTTYLKWAKNLRVSLVPLDGGDINDDQ
jgi:hypothetical protein